MNCFFPMPIKFTILGCGSSLGIPRIDGHFGNCDPKNPKNYRSRCSALISSKNKNFLIDSSPDIKNQLIRSKVKQIDKIFYTHPHADQTHGINELRVFYLKNKKKIDVYADKSTKKYLLNSFSYCFKNSFDYPATLKMNNLRKLHNYNDNKQIISIKSISVQHGLIKSMAYIINNKCAYVSDVSKIYDKDLSKFKRLKYFVIDCLRYNSHPSHYCLNEVLNLINFIKPSKTILTNLNNEIDYNQIKKKLPKNVVPAYDGMNFLI